MKESTWYSNGRIASVTHSPCRDTHRYQAFQEQFLRRSDWVFHQPLLQYTFFPKKNFVKTFRTLHESRQQSVAFETLYIVTKKSMDNVLCGQRSAFEHVEIFKQNIGKKNQTNSKMFKFIYGWPLANIISLVVLLQVISVDLIQGTVKILK